MQLFNKYLNCTTCIMNLNEEVVDYPTLINFYLAIKQPLFTSLF